MNDADWHAVLAIAAGGHGGVAVTRYLDVPSQPSCVREGRRFLRDILNGSAQTVGAFADDRIDAAQLLVSELITNAILYARSKARLAVSLLHASQSSAAGVAAAAAVVGVADRSDELPQAREPSMDRQGGRGLQIVEMLSDGWGCAPLHDTDGKVVWFRVDAVPSQRRANQQRTVFDGDNPAMVEETGSD